MKKSLLILAAFAAAALVSCTEIIVEQPVVDPDGTTVLTPGEGGTHFSFSVIREDPATKSYLSGTDFLWEDGEEISVCYGGSNVKFTYDEATGKFNSDAFDPEAAGPFYVVAPYNAGITIDGSGKIHTELPANQVDKGKGLDPAALLSVGKAADVAALTAGISLKNAFSLVKVAVSDSDVDRISIDGNYSGTAISPLLAGEVTVDPADGSVVATGRGTSVSLTSAGGNFAAGAYILAVLPQTMTNGIKMVFRRAGEAQSYYRNSSKSISFVRNAGISFAAVSVAGLTKRCYYVNDAADLQAWNVTSPNALDITWFGSDIDMDGESWTPRSNFEGTLDAQNHRLYNISATTNDYCGFIKTTKDAGSASIVNLIVGTRDGVNWDGVSTFVHSGSTGTGTWNYVGVIAKTMGATTVENIVNFAKMEVAAGSASETRIGGIVGNWDSSSNLVNCINYGSVSNNAADCESANGGAVGGIVGQVDASVTIDGCINYGTVFNSNPMNRYVGGVVANSGASLTVQNCENHGTVNVTAMKVSQWGSTGGLIGYVINSTVKDCLVDGALIKNESPRGSLASGQEWRVPTGGLIGYSEKNTIKDCEIRNSSITSTCWCVGGFVGNTENAVLFDGCIVKDCSVSGYNDVGGFVGYNLTNSRFDNCDVKGTTVSGNEEIGGFCGYSKTSGVFNSCLVDDSEISSSTDDVGGIVGWCVSSTVNGCQTTNSTINATTHYAGGIVGLAQVTTVSDCIVSGSSVTAPGTSAGGIAGYTKNAGSFTFDKCLVSNSTVKAKYNVGGIIGYAYSNGSSNVQNVNVFNCGTDASTILQATYSDGTPPGGDCEVAGICGWMRLQTTGSFRIVNCYCNASIKCDQSMNTLSAGGAIGYCSMGSGTGEISNFCSSLTSDKILVNGSPVSTSTRVGAICGMLPDKPIEVSNCYYIDDLTASDTFGASVVLSGNEAFSEATFKDGTTVPAKLNAFVASYGGSETLKTWTVNGAGLPVLND